MTDDFLKQLGYTITSTQLADRLKVTRSRIRQLGPRLREEGLGQVVGRSWFFKEQAVEFIRNLPNGRGRPPINKNVKD